MSEREGKKGYEIKTAVESHDNNFHPAGGENLENTCVRAPHVQTLPILLLTPTVLSEL